MTSDDVMAIRMVMTMILMNGVMQHCYYSSPAACESEI